MSHEDWFDNYGWIQKEIPKEAVEDCSHSGACDSDVAHWREKLDFQVPRQMAIDYIEEYGAWTKEELESHDDEGLAEIILWLACGDIKENGEWLGLVH